MWQKHEYAHVPSILKVWAMQGESRLNSNVEHWSNDKNAVNITSGLVISISCLQSMSFENIYEIEISERMISPGCHVKLLTGILWEK
jgi:hypothetical protein